MSIKFFKNLCLIFFTLILLSGCSTENNLNFDNENYKLQFSKKSPLTKGYINEYIKPNENIKNWTTLIGVYDYPNQSSPIIMAKNLGKIVKQANKDAGVSVIINEKENAGVVDFLTWSLSKESKEIEFLEFNIFKFKKGPKNNVIALQYAHRFYNKEESLNTLRETIIEYRKKYIPVIINTPIPNIVNKDI